MSRYEGRGQDLNVGIVDNIFRQDLARPFFLNMDHLRFIGMDLQAKILDIQNDIGDILFHPGIVENSCRTPSILIDVTAAPAMDERRTRRSELPMVLPNPRSNGSAKNFPYVFVSVSFSTSSFLVFENLLF